MCYVFETKFVLYSFTAARILREMRQTKALEDEHLHQDEKTQYQVTGLASRTDNSTVGAGASTIESDDKVISDSVSNYDKGLLTNKDMFITDIEYDSKEKNNKGLFLKNIDKDYEMPRSGIINPGYMDEKAESYKRIENKGVGSRNIITNKNDDETRPHLKVFVPKLIEILKSPTFVFLCFAVSFTYMLMTSVSVFLPKLIQNQYNHTATMAGILSGKYICTMNGKSNTRNILNPLLRRLFLDHDILFYFKTILKKIKKILS